MSVPAVDHALEQCLGLDGMLEALRTQAHEQANRLHALSGLLALGMQQEARDLLSDCIEDLESSDAQIVESLAIPAVAGLVVGKRALARAQGVSVQLDPTSSLLRLPPGLTDLDAISLIGNLLDNAVDAVVSLPRRRRRVRLLVCERDRLLHIAVRDWGEGVIGEAIDDLFRSGVTSKRGHAGVGLSVVAAIASRCDGVLTIARHEHGVTFEVSFQLD